MVQEQNQFVTRSDQLTSFETPLREIKGKLEAIKPLVRNNFTVGILQVSELQVIKTELPFNNQAVEIEVPFSGRKNSTWAKLLESAEGLGFKDLMELVGKRIHMVGAMEKWENKTKQTSGQNLVWKIVGVEGAATAANGAGAVDELAEMVKLADGKTAGEFANAALQHPIGRRYQKDIFDGKLLPGLVASGKLTLKDDKYQAVK